MNTKHLFNLNLNKISNKCIIMRIFAVIILICALNLSFVTETYAEETDCIDLDADGYCDTCHKAIATTVVATGNVTAPHVHSGTNGTTSANGCYNEPYTHEYTTEENDYYVNKYCGRGTTTGYGYCSNCGGCDPATCGGCAGDWWVKKTVYHYETRYTCTKKTISAGTFDLIKTGAGTNQYLTYKITPFEGFTQVDSTSALVDKSFCITAVKWTYKTNSGTETTVSTEKTAQITDIGTYTLTLSLTAKSGNTTSSSTVSLSYGAEASDLDDINNIFKIRKLEEDFWEGTVLQLLVTDEYSDKVKIKSAEWSCEESQYSNTSMQGFVSASVEDYEPKGTTIIKKRKTELNTDNLDECFLAECFCNGIFTANFVYTDIDGNGEYNASISYDEEDFGIKYDNIYVDAYFYSTSKNPFVVTGDNYEFTYINANNEYSQAGTLQITNVFGTFDIDLVDENKKLYLEKLPYYDRYNHIQNFYQTVYCSPEYKIILNHRFYITINLKDYYVGSCKYQGKSEIEVKVEYSLLTHQVDSDYTYEQLDKYSVNKSEKYHTTSHRSRGQASGTLTNTVITYADSTNHVCPVVECKFFDDDNDGVSDYCYIYRDCSVRNTDDGYYPIYVQIDETKEDKYGNIESYLSDYAGCTITRTAKNKTVSNDVCRSFETTVEFPTTIETDTENHTTEEKTFTFTQNDTPQHKYSFVYVEPTCLDDGYYHYICSNCGYDYDEKISDAYGHTYSYEIIEPVTQTTDGIIKGICERCQNEITVTIKCPNKDTQAGTTNYFKTYRKRAIARNFVLKGTVDREKLFYDLTELFKKNKSSNSFANHDITISGYDGYSVLFNTKSGRYKSVLINFNLDGNKTDLDKNSYNSNGFNLNGNDSNLNINSSGSSDFNLNNRKTDNPVINFILNVIDAIINAIKDLIDKIIDAIKDLIDWLLNALHNIIGFFKEHFVLFISLIAFLIATIIFISIYLMKRSKENTQN